MVCEGTSLPLLSLRKKSIVLVVLFVVLIMLGGFELVSLNYVGNFRMCRGETP